MLFEVDGGHLENQNGTIIRRRNVEECETTIRRQGWAHPELHDQEHHHHMRGGIRSSPLIFIIFQIITSLALVAGAWSERKKMFHGGSFLKLVDLFFRKKIVIS